MTSIPTRPFQKLVSTPSGKISVEGNARYAPSSSFTTRLMPKQFSSNPWDNRSFVDIPVETLDIDVVDEWFLRMVVNCGPDAAADLNAPWGLLLRPAVFFIQQIEVRVNDEPVEVLKNYSLWQEKLAYSSIGDANLEGEYGNFWSLGDITPTRLNGVDTLSEDGKYSMFVNTLCENIESGTVGGAVGPLGPNSPTKILVIPFSTVLEKCKINWRIVSQHNRVTFRILFNNKSACWWANTYNVTGLFATDPAIPSFSYYTDGGAAYQSMTDPSIQLQLLELYARGVRLTPNERNKQDSAYLTSGAAFTSTAMRTIEQQIPQVVQPSSTDTNEIVLSGVVGTITNFMAYIAVKPENLPDAYVTNDLLGAGTQVIGVPTIQQQSVCNLGWNSIYPTMYTLKDSNGNPVSAQSLPVEIDTLANAATIQNHPFSKLIIVYNFAADPKRALEEGEVSGGIYFNNWRLSFNSAGYVFHSSGDGFFGVPSPTAFVTMYQLCQVIVEAGTGRLRLVKI